MRNCLLFAKNLNIFPAIVSAIDYFNDGQNKVKRKMLNRFKLSIIVLLLPLFVLNCGYLGLSKSEQKDTTTEEKKEKATPKNQSEKKSSKKESTSEISENDVQTIIDDLSNEIKKLQANQAHNQNQINELKAQASIWGNPFSIFNKEILLDNGTTVYGKITYQDTDIIKAETLIGTLTIDRKTVVRVVENTTSLEPATEDESTEDVENEVVLDAQNPIVESGVDLIERRQGGPVANLILVGNITETKDNSGNTMLTGEIKNIGTHRADFAKINFIIRQNWSGQTKTLTAFVKGSYHKFDSEITSDSSIMPGETASFELIIPKSFGTFIGYSTTIDWEQYD